MVETLQIFMSDLRLEPAGARRLVAARDCRPAHHRRLSSADGPQSLGGGAAPPRAERRRTLWPVAVVRRSFEVRVQGTADPFGLRQGRVPAGAAGDGNVRAGRVGGDSDQREQLGQVGHFRHERRNPLPARDFLARRLRHHHGRLGLQLEVPVHGQPQVGGADGVV